MEIIPLKRHSTETLNEIKLINNDIQLKLNNNNKMKLPNIVIDYTKHNDEELMSVPLKNINFVVRSRFRLNTALNLLDEISSVYPIRLIVNDSGYQLNDGNHRCAACVLRNYTHIWALVRK